MSTNKKTFVLRKKRVPTYTVTAIKNPCTPDFIEVISGLSEDLMYRCGMDLRFKPSVWMMELNKGFESRFFVDSNGMKHYMREFEKIGDGDPYASVDLILIEATAFGLRNNVEKMAETYMLSGIPTVDSYQAAYEYWTDW